MKIGLYLRNIGPQSTRALVAGAAHAAEAEGVDDLRGADHVALPPEESEGSDGRDIGPLATLAFLTGVTERVVHPWRYADAAEVGRVMAARDALAAWR